ncbi:hypothetical protein [Microviridae sp.]|nr:hypothetical protein [Microviridae sp.]
MKTPIRNGDRNVPVSDFKTFMAEWSLAQAEANHVETMEEANDFEIYEEEDDFFPQQLTVYEMHDDQETRLALEALEAESIDSAVLANDNSEHVHAQSAQHEPTPPLTNNNTDSLSNGEA